MEGPTGSDSSVASLSPPPSGHSATVTLLSMLSFNRVGTIFRQFHQPGIFSAFTMTWNSLPIYIWLTLSLAYLKFCANAILSVRIAPSEFKFVIHGSPLQFVPFNLPQNIYLQPRTLSNSISTNFTFPCRCLIDIQLNTSQTELLILPPNLLSLSADGSSALKFNCSGQKP